MTKDRAEREVCEFDDVAKPLAFGVYLNEVIRGRVFGQLNLEPHHFADIEAYGRWAGEVDVLTGMVNLHRIIYQLIRLKETDGL